MKNLICYALLFLVGAFIYTAVQGDESLIVGSLDWKDVDTLPPNSPEYQNSKAVGELRNDNNEACNAVHVGGGAFFTAGHCIVGRVLLGGKECRTVDVDYVKDIGRLVCPGLFGEHGFAGVPAAVTERIYVLHHQCDWYTDPYCRATLKYSPGRILNRQGSRVCYDADTLPGSSGAPVFNSKHELLAIHHSAVMSEGYNCGSLLESGE